MGRPLIVIRGRFSQSASALRYRAVVTARALSDAVLRSGGEPLGMHPWAPSGILDRVQVAERLAFADGVLLPGGGDLDPSRYGADVAHGEVYDVDDEQDAFDLAVAAWALSAAVPTLAICRGTQVVNVARGGSMEQHMDSPHRDVLLPVTVNDPELAGLLGSATPRPCRSRATTTSGCSGWAAAWRWRPRLGTGPWRRSPSPASRRVLADGSSVCIGIPRTPRPPTPLRQLCSKPLWPRRSATATSAPPGLRAGARFDGDGSSSTN